jgi:hypothetical protein
LASGLTNLVQLDLRGNQLASLTLPFDLFRLSALILDGNPLRTLILSETQAATQLAGLVATLRAQGVSIVTYPVNLQLNSPNLTGADTFSFTLTGPPGVYIISKSTDFEIWNKVGFTTNTTGSVVFTDFDSPLLSRKFYRAELKIELSIDDDGVPF